MTHLSDNLSDIRFSLIYPPTYIRCHTYLPKNLTSYVNAPQDIEEEQHRLLDNAEF